MGSTSRPALKTALLAVGLSIGTGLLFSYFFGFFAGVLVFLGSGTVFSILFLRGGSSTAERISLMIALIFGMLLLTYVFGFYGLIVYVVALLAFYFIRRKPKVNGAAVPLP